MDLVHCGTSLSRLFVDERSYQTSSNCGMLLLEEEMRLQHVLNSYEDVLHLSLIRKVRKGGRRGSSKC